MMIRIRTERNKKSNWSPINRVKTDVATVTLNVTNIARARELNSFSLVASSMVFFSLLEFFVCLDAQWLANMHTRYDYLLERQLWRGRRRPQCILFIFIHSNCLSLWLKSGPIQPSTYNLYDLKFLVSFRLNSLQILIVTGFE